MSSLQQAVAAWLQQAEAKAAQQTLGTTDLQELQQLVQRAQPRQHLLYLQTKTPAINAAVIGMAHHQPTPGGSDRIYTRTEWPYATVHDAIIDGWQVIHFPQLMAPYDDRELNYVGYEFVLHKVEEIIKEKSIKEETLNE